VEEVVSRHLESSEGQRDHITIVLLITKTKRKCLTKASFLHSHNTVYPKVSLIFIDFNK